MTPPPTAPGYVGCRGDSSQPPHEEGASLFYVRDGSLGDDLTIDGCLDRARQANSTYAGVGHSCWYDSTMDAGGTHQAVGCRDTTCSVSVFKSELIS